MLYKFITTTPSSIKIINNSLTLVISENILVIYCSMSLNASNIQLEGSSVLKSGSTNRILFLPN